MHASSRFLTALPVYNERDHVGEVLKQVVQYCSNILVVDDGSTDGTREILDDYDVEVVRHEPNRGYGSALITAFQYAIEHDFDVLITIDCDGQHEPQRIPRFVAACQDVDIVSGSRYLKAFSGDSTPPAQRRWINQVITAELNRRLGLNLTDAFCGFKAYGVDALKKLDLLETGYAMPLELWVEAARANLSVVELAVPLIYLDESRSFGGSLDDAKTRIDYYHQVIQRSLKKANLECVPAVPSCDKGTG